MKHYDTDNLIYNRFDLIYPDSVQSRQYSYGEESYEILVHCEEGVAELNLWGKVLPEQVLTDLIGDVFRDSNIYAIRITRGGNQFRSFLETTNDIRVPLPNSIDELLSRSDRRDRATIRRKLRWLDERIGHVEIATYGRDDIPLSIVETYFSWKKETHNTEYGLTPDGYLDKYHVTDAMVMKALDTDVAVAFFCQIGETVFFENFSYNTLLKEYSPGLLMYVKLMEELINRRCRYLYLGGGSYVYKTRFGAESSVAYSGLIYRQEIVDSVDQYFSDDQIDTIAFYGFGVCGHSFLQLSHGLKINVLYGIDMNQPEESDIRILSPEDDLPHVDAVIITLNNKNRSVEEMLSKRFSKVYYWNDILDSAITDYRRRLHERT